MNKRKSIYTKDVILVMAASFFFMFSTMFVTPILNGYAKDLGATSTFAGIIVGVMSIVAIFLRPIAGNLTDRYSKYLLSLIGGIMIFIGVVGYCFAPKSGWLLLFRIINGIGYVLGTVCLSTWLSLLVPRQHVGEAMGFYGLMNALAMALAPALAIDLYPRVGYRLALIAAVLAALLMVISIQFVQNRAEPLNKKGVVKKKKFHLIQKNVLPVMFLTTLFAFPYFTTQADIVIYVAQKKVDVAVGSFFLIYAVVLLVIRLWLKKYFDLVRFGIWFWISTASMVLCIYFLANMKNNWEMALGAVFLATSYGIIYSVLQSTALLLAPINEQGIASSTFYLGLDFGMAFGPIISGIVDQILPLKYFYPVELVLVPIILLIYFKYRKRLNNAINEH